MVVLLGWLGHSTCGPEQVTQATKYEHIHVCHSALSKLGRKKIISILHYMHMPDTHYILHTHASLF